MEKMKTKEENEKTLEHFNKIHGNAQQIASRLVEEKITDISDFKPAIIDDFGTYNDIKYKDINISGAGENDIVIWYNEEKEIYFYITKDSENIEKIQEYIDSYK